MSECLQLAAAGYEPLQKHNIVSGTQADELLVALELIIIKTNNFMSNVISANSMFSVRQLYHLNFIRKMTCDNWNWIKFEMALPRCNATWNYNSPSISHQECDHIQKTVDTMRLQQNGYFFFFFFNFKNAALVQIMDWQWSLKRPLSEPMTGWFAGR